MTRMTMQILTATMGLVVLFPAAMSRAQRSEGSTKCYAIRVGTPDTEQSGTKTNRRRASRRAPEFSASQILDLEFQVLLPPSLSGDHLLELKIMTPKGHLYQAFSVPFSAQNASETDGRQARGHRSRRSRSQAAKATLPVAGTTIVTSSLYGKWSAEAYLDGAQGSCTAPQSFVIEP